MYNSHISAIPEWRKLRQKNSGQPIFFGCFTSSKECNLKKSIPIMNYLLKITNGKMALGNVKYTHL